MKTFFLVLSLIAVASESCFSATPFEEQKQELAKILELSDLKSLAAKNKNIEVYRLLVERSFDAVLLFEAVREKDGPARFYVRRVRQESEGPAKTILKLTRNSSHSMSEHEFATLVSILKGCSFWKLPGEDWRESSLDGSTWTFEAVKDGFFHGVVRSNPFLEIDSSKGHLRIQSAYNEGLLISGFTYLWAFSGEASEEIY